MADLVGNGGELNFTVEVTRKDGKVETYQMTGKVTHEDVEELELVDGHNPLDSGA